MREGQWENNIVYLNWGEWDSDVWESGEWNAPPTHKMYYMSNSLTAPSCHGHNGIQPLASELTRKTSPLVTPGTEVVRREDNRGQYSFKSETSFALAMNAVFGEV